MRSRYDVGVDLPGEEVDSGNALALNPVTLGDLAVLKSPAFELPKRLGRRRSFNLLLEQVYDAFFDHLDELDGPLAESVDARRRRIETLASSIVDAWCYGWEGKVDSALGRLDTGLRSVEKELVSMSRRHSRVLPSQCWYRLAAWPGVRTREHMFHTPFELPQLSYRFSAPGAPALYLANSVYLCWLECGRPAFKRCFVARFELDTTGFEVIDIPAGSDAYVAPLDFPPLPGVEFDPRRVMNSPYNEDVLSELAEFLTLWPLLASTTARKPERALKRPAEYVVPQLLMLWLRESGRYLGVRYFTSKPDRSTNSNDWSINLALPARTQKAAGYCDFLRSRLRWTEPQSLAEVRGLRARDILTPSAVDLREQRGGRVMLQRGRSLQPYFETAFGKMEYWLDRTELKLATI